MTIPAHHIEVERLLALVEAENNRRKELMPDENAAIKMLFDAYTRLKDFGWRPIIYCPKDGSVFKVIEAGSTGKHDCIYDGEWPNGSWWILSDGDMSPSFPTMFKPPTDDHSQRVHRRTTETTRTVIDNVPK